MAEKLDLPLPPLRCKIGFHKYSVWGAKFNLPQANTCFEYQQKICVLCGIVKERRI
jgi:hypothetical protein